LAAIFKKYLHPNRVICVILTLYMLNAFTIVNLLVEIGVHHLSQISLITNGTGTSNFYAPKKTSNKALYLFMSQRKIVKAVILSENIKTNSTGPQNTKLPVIAAANSYKLNTVSFSLSDEAYKRYRNLKVFLI
jgi:hypothetical protein